MQGNVLFLGPLEDVADYVQSGLETAGHCVSRASNLADISAEDLRRTDVLFARGYVPITRAVFNSAPNLRAVVAPYIGTEGFRVDDASDAGVLIVSGQTPENYESMAEATVLLMLASLYDLDGAQAELAHGLRGGRKTSVARMLKGKVVGLLSFGQIARSVADRLVGWGVTINAYFPRQHGQLPDHVKRVEWEELLDSSDVLCVLAPINEETRHLMDSQALQLMKPGSVLICTSRGGIIDEAALAANAPRFKMIALDVFEKEPLAPDSPLRTLPNVILTPHNVGHTEESLESIPPNALQNVLKVLQGEPPSTVRNPHIVASWLKRWGVDS